MSGVPNKMDSAGAKSVMSNDMKEVTQGEEEISNVIRGHKANLSNPSEHPRPLSEKSVDANTETHRHE